MLNFARSLFRWSAFLVIALVLAQVFLAGMVVVSNLIPWDLHRDLGHIIGIPIMVMLIGAYVGRLPAIPKRATWLLFLVYVIQADVLIFMRNSLPLVAALHPVLALIVFWLAIRAWRTTRPEELAA